MTKTTSRTLKEFLSPARFQPSGSEDLLGTTGQQRSPYEVDGDKIVFTDGFRALADKTQVHDRATRSGIHRNRLTHSTEVSRVGRSLGVAVGARMTSYYGLHAAAAGEAFWNIEPGAIGAVVSNACLAHDMGNPPLGHDGEDAISNFFRATEIGQEAVSRTSAQVGAELCLHEGNAQGFRMITRSMGWRETGGLNLTAATLAAFGKYPFILRPGQKKYGIHAADMPIMDWVAKETGMIPTEGGYLRHPLAWLMEAADDVSYLTVDLEDATFIGLVHKDELFDLYADVVGQEEIDKAISMESLHHSIQYLRSRMIKTLITGCVEVYADIAEELDKGTLKKNAFGGGLVGYSRHGEAMHRIREFSSANIYRAPETQADRALFRKAMETALKHLVGQMLLHLDRKSHTIDVDDPAFRALRFLPSVRFQTRVPMDADRAMPWLMDQITLLSDADIIDISTLE